MTTLPRTRATTKLPDHEIKARCAFTRRVVRVANKMMPEGVRAYRYRAVPVIIVDLGHELEASPSRQVDLEPHYALDDESHAIARLVGEALGLSECESYMRHHEATTAMVARFYDTPLNRSNCHER